MYNDFFLLVAGIHYLKMAAWERQTRGNQEPLRTPNSVSKYAPISKQGHPMSKPIGAGRGLRFNSVQTQQQHLGSNFKPPPPHQNMFGSGYQTSPQQRFIGVNFSRQPHELAPQLKMARNSYAPPTQHMMGGGDYKAPSQQLTSCDTYEAWPQQRNFGGSYKAPAQQQYFEGPLQTPTLVAPGMIVPIESHSQMPKVPSQPAPNSQTNYGMDPFGK